MQSIAEQFEHFRKITDDIPAAILAVGSVLTGQQAATKPLTVRQAAEFLGVSADAIYSLCQSGKLRHHRVGNRRGTIRIQPVDLVRLQNEAA
jgi:excisionase family DNA binding protein